MLCASPAHADAWLGPDKALHFTASASLAAGGWGAGALLSEDVRVRALAGAGLALGAGAAKEAWDWATYGRPSARDMAWNAVGATTGLLLSWTVDVALRRLLQ
jgi:putative lipoprotein